MLLMMSAPSTTTVACGRPAAETATPRPEPAKLGVKVVRRLPHDRRAFTQGLVYFEGKLYESTGLPGESSLRRVDPETGRVEARVDLPAPLFGEGLARVGEELVQLTWQNGRAFVWGLRDFARVREHVYVGEGWGLCTDGERLVMSNGSDRLVFREPRTFVERGEVAVRDGAQPVDRLNELECVEGVVYANLWGDERIARIDLASGRVTGWVDASGLLAEQERRAADVLNGIAYVPERKTFFVTGKLWPHLFEVELVPGSF